MPSSEIPSFVYSLKRKTIRSHIKNFKNISNYQKIDFFKMKTYGQMVLPISTLEGAYIKKHIYILHKSFLIDVSYERNNQN